MAFPTPELLLSWRQEYEQTLQKLDLESPLRADLRTRIQALEQAYRELQVADPGPADAEQGVIVAPAPAPEGVIITLPVRPVRRPGSAATAPGYPETGRPESLTG